MNPQEIFLVRGIGREDLFGSDNRSVCDSLSKKEILLDGEAVPFRKGKSEMVGLKKFHALSLDPPFLPCA
jgi:hypothetical protein